MPEAVTVAQAVGFNWTEIIGQFGLYAILVWYLWYQTAVAQPKLIEKHETNHAALVKQNNDTVREICSDFTSKLKQLDDSRTRDRETLLARATCQAFHSTQSAPKG